VIDISDRKVVAVIWNHFYKNWAYFDVNRSAHVSMEMKRHIDNPIYTFERRIYNFIRENYGKLEEVTES
jgi:hypothetical protein